MTDAHPQDLTEQQRQWLATIQHCESSGQSMKAYADEHGIDIKTLYGRKKALVKPGVLPRSRLVRFQRAQVIDPVSRCEWRIQLPNGLSVTGCGSVDAGLLGTLLTTAAMVE